MLFVEHSSKPKEHLFKKAKEKGYRIFLATDDVPDHLHKYIDKHDVILTNPLSSRDLLIDVITYLNINKISFNAVGTLEEQVVVPTADLAEALNLPGVGSTAARCSSRNKLLMRETLRRGDFSKQPKCQAVNIFGNNVFDIIAQFPKPCVIKPLFGSASHGVKKIESNETILSDLEDVRRTIKSELRSIFSKYKGHMLLEEYIPGTVISVDGIVRNHQIEVFGTVEFIMGGEPYFTQVASYIPSHLDETTRKNCESLAAKIINLLNFDTTGFHCEIKLAPDGPKLIEIAARLPGAGIYASYDVAYGSDFIGSMIDAWFGKIQHLTRPSKPKKYTYHHNVYPNIHQRSRLTSITGLDEVSHHDAVWNFQQVSRDGDILNYYPDIPSILYSYTLQTSKQDELKTLSIRIESLVNYKADKI